MRGAGRAIPVAVTNTNTAEKRAAVRVDILMVPIVNSGMINSQDKKHIGTCSSKKTIEENMFTFAKF